MSLMDAFLLDAAPFEVWIAPRTDGVIGSGTQSDPYDGSTRPYPDISITSLSRSGTEATAVTSTEHGFSEGDAVTVSGVTVNLLDTANWTDVFYTGTFQVQVLSSTSFKYTMLGAPASAQAPGTITCHRERERFDTLMRSMPENTTVRLGPGVFETKGYAPNVRTWMQKSGQKILGSGIGVTTLKLVGAAVAEMHYWAIGRRYEEWLHDFEVAELTIDCNIAGQPNQQVTCGAVLAFGRHIRIRRVRAINWGSQTKTYVENFVLFSGSTHPDLAANGQGGEDCVIEDCIVERPSANPVNNSTLLMIGGEERILGDGFMAFHRACAIRNCFVDGRIHYGPVVPIDSITSDGTTVTVTTKAPHGRSPTDNVLVQGVTVGGGLDNLFNGVFAVAQVPSATVLKYSLTSSQTPDGSNARLGGGVFPHPVSIEKLEYDDDAEVCDTLALPYQYFENPTFKITTRARHCRTTRNNVRVEGIRKPAVPNPVYSVAFNGAFAVADYDPKRPKELKYTLLQEPDAPLGTLVTNWGQVNRHHFALSADNGTAAVVEGNRVFHCTIGGPYHDTWPTLDLVVRNNYYHDVLFGPFQTLVSVSSGLPLSLASLNCDSTTAQAKTSFPHGLSVNDFVTISGADQGAYNGWYRITDVPAPDRFEYTMPSTPPAPATYARYSTWEDVPPVVSSQKRVESVFHVARGGKHIVSAKTTYENHGFAVGDAVRITKAGHFDMVQHPNSTLFNGNVRVTAVPNPKTFEYELSGDPGVDSENQELAVHGVKGIEFCLPGEAGIDSESEEFAAGFFGRIRQTKRWVVESNVIELGITTFPFNTDDGRACGIYLSGEDVFFPAYSFPQVIIRGNVIRNVDDAPVPPTRAMILGGCENALVENNVIGVDRSEPMEHDNAGETRTFNNMTPAGVLRKSKRLANAPREAVEVVTQVREDPIISWFLNL